MMGPPKYSAWKAGDFDWQELPRLPILWQLPGQEALPLDELLRRVQTELKTQVKAA